MAFKSPFFGFIEGHAYLKKNELNHIKKLVGKEDNDTVANFEIQFAKLIGNGDAIAYAAARMGFYNLMQVLEIGEGDEVILLGSTCAVMSTAVIQTGATPIYSDVDTKPLAQKVNLSMIVFQKKHV